MKAPRIIGSTSEAPPFAGDLPAMMGTLAPYTNDAGHTADLPVVTPVLAPQRLRHRADFASMVTLALLGASALTLALALALSVRQQRTSISVDALVDKPVVIAASGRGGSGHVRCMSDIVTVTVTGTGVSSDGVMIGWVEAPTGTAQLVLRPAGMVFRGYIFVDRGVLRTDARARGFSVWPGERIVLHIEGLLGARELRVGGKQVFLGSRGDRPCV